MSEPLRVSMSPTYTQWCATYKTELRPLPDDWSPAEITLALAQAATGTGNSSVVVERLRQYELQRGIAQAQARMAGGSSWCQHSCEVHDDLEEVNTVHAENVVEALKTEKMSGAARKRILAALGIEE